MIALIILGSSLTLCGASAVYALYDASWHELKEYARSKRRKERFDQIYEAYDDAIIAVDTLRTLGLYLIVTGQGFAHLRSTRPWPLWGVIGIGVFWVLLCNVWIPRTVSTWFGTQFLYHFWPTARVIGRILSPLSWGLLTVDRFVRGLDRNSAPVSEEAAFVDEIRTIVAEGQNEGLLEADARDMIEGVIDLDDADVADVMTPRSEIDSVAVDMEWPQLLAYVAEAGRTRLPVYEGAPDNIIGILYVKDLLTQLAQPDPARRRSLREMMRKPIRVPRSTHLDELLQQFLQERQHLFLVVDELSNLAGLVTIEDVLEEIVGEILDESDEEAAPEIQILDDRSAVVLGRTHVENLNDALGLQLPLDADFDTVGGFLLRQFERIPVPGDSLTWQGTQFSVLAATSRRVEQVKVTTLIDADELQQVDPSS